MKKLLLIRHAKAEKDTSVKDADRPLKYIGIQDATFMAERLKDSGNIPQLIVTSPALRTKTTAEIFADHLSLPEPEIKKNIYAATQVMLLKVISQLPNEYDFIAIVAHNPGIEQILDYLTGESREVHTSTLALIEFDTNNWAEISGDTGKLTYFVGPNGQF